MAVPCPHARAARPPADPTDPCSATARSADPGSAAATNWRRALGLALKLRDAFLLPGHALAQHTDLLIHPQQHRDHDLTALLEDRLRIDPLHTTGFAASPLCPPTN